MELAEYTKSALVEELEKRGNIVYGIASPDDVGDILEMWNEWKGTEYTLGPQDRADVLELAFQHYDAWDSRMMIIEHQLEKRFNPSE